MSRVEVHKFGGTSVGSAARMMADAQIIVAAAANTSIVVVTSAMSGVTDRLIDAANAATDGDRQGALRVIASLQQAHLNALDTLTSNNTEGAHPVAAGIETICGELHDLMSAVVLLGELTPRTRDRILASGEKLSARLLAVAMREAGIDAIALDADKFLETDANFGEANPLSVVSDRTIQAAISPHLAAGRVPIVTGFCGIAPDGATTTLGRGGSDYTATLIAAAIDADEVTIWTDVDGVFSADPRVEPNARVVEQLNYREAAELSFYGAKVLHQRTMIPVASEAIPVRTRNSMNPSAPGTLVDGCYTPGSHPVKAISAVRDQSMVSIEGKGMAGVPGIAARVFQCLANRSISVTMISQSSSESSITLVIPANQADRAASSLKNEFRTDLSHGDIEEITVQPNVGLIACVGLGMAHVPGVSGRVFSALGVEGVNVLAIAQGSSELNISLAVSTDQIPDAIRTLHHAFDLHRIDTGVDTPDGLDILLLGCGNIGRALIAQIMDRSAHVFERFGLHPRVVTIADRSGYVLAPAGFSREALDKICAHKAAGKPIAQLPGALSTDSPLDMVNAALAYRLSRPILVDVSDADGSTEVFARCLKRGCDVVTANKKPLAGPIDGYRTLYRTVDTQGRILRAEATVGAGLPVVDTLDMLLATGDTLVSAEGCLSGTLGFLMSALETGKSFSASVREAVELGYTEPDPVADLCGIDVARKAIILARRAGLASGETDVVLTGLVDASMSGTPLKALFAHLESLDAAMAERVSAAAKDGCVLRYIARVTDDQIVVGPAAVPKDSPLGGLQGSDNMIVFVSERYNDRPLVVSGPGAGIDVTAMGVLGDILRVAAERRTP
jgi:aspartokinase/homoserine dehydrogenase 1